MLIVRPIHHHQNNKLRRLYHTAQCYRVHFVHPLLWLQLHSRLSQRERWIQHSYPLAFDVPFVELG